MNKKIITTLVTGLMLGTQAFAVDLNDDLLVAYKLTESEEAEFSLTDDAIAPFWEKYGGLDQINMNFNDNSVPGKPPFDGPEDAALDIRAAWSSTGLYLYAKVVDNNFVPPADFGQIGCDALDLYLNSQVREEIMATPKEDMATPWRNAINKTTKQIQVWMAANEVNYQYYDEVLMSWVGIAGLGGTNVITLEEAQEKYNGLGMEIHEVNATTRVQEWFIPWIELGKDVSALTGDNRLFGFSGGYNDKDDATAEFSSDLRWLNHDPWSGGPREDPNDPKSPTVTKGACLCPEWAIDSWGHIELSDEGISGIGVNHFVQNRNIPISSNIVKTEYYTIQGQKITQSALRQLKTSSMVIERHFLDDGSSLIRRIQTTR